MFTRPGHPSIRRRRMPRMRHKRQLMLRGLLPVALGAWLSTVVGCRSGSEDSLTYPNRPIKLYVPFSAGGSTDTVTRIIQTAVRKHDLLPQPLAIINLEGAGGTIGSRRVKDARPDAYSILQLNEAS